MTGDAVAAMAVIYVAGVVDAAGVVGIAVVAACVVFFVELVG